MQLPPEGSSYTRYVIYGRYVARRLRRARKTDLAASVDKIVQQVKTFGRAAEDAAEPVQDALADRDAADDDLDEAAQTGRARLAGRSVDAMQKPPYTLIYADGIGYYTAAPIDEEEARYGELKKRAEEHLPAKDEVRVLLVKAIDAGVPAFHEASSALSKARTEEALAGTRLDAAIDAFEKHMEKVYGALVHDEGRTKAERFFPKVRASRKKPAAAPAEGGTDQ